MKAAVLRSLGGPEVLSIEDVGVPEPGPGEVLIKVQACGVCHHEIVVRNGTHRRLADLPQIMGHEIAGTIVALGDATGARLPEGSYVVSKQLSSCGDCGYCRSGQETLCDNFGVTVGGNAEYAVVRESSLVAVPAGIRPAHACVLACAVGVGYHALSMANVTLGDTVLVTGAGGGVGLHTVQLAKLRGARVIAQTGTDSKVGAIESMGADEVIVSPTLDFSSAVLELTDGRGVSVVMENVGAAAFDQAWRSLAKAGRLAFVGATSTDKIAINPGRICMKGAHLFGSVSTTRQELEEIVELAIAGVVTPQIWAEMPLDDVSRAHEMMEARSMVGRMVLIP